MWLEKFYKTKFWKVLNETGVYIFEAHWRWAYVEGLEIQPESIFFKNLLHPYLA